MLKVERIAKENKIAVTYKDRTSLFTKDFIIALAVAFFFHFSFLFLFTIKDIGLLFHLHPSKLNFNVESIVPYKHISLDADSISEKEEISEPQKTVFKLTTPSWAVEKHFDESLLHIDYKPSLAFEDRFPFTKAPMQKEPIQVLAYHGMAGRILLNQNKLAAFKSNERGYVKFNVQIDDKQGNIIWSELKTFIGSRTLIQQANRILQSLVFSAIDNSFVSFGEIEIVFND